MAEDIQYGEAGEWSDAHYLEMPAPTLWPLLLAVSLLFTFLGLITHSWISYAGLVFTLSAAVGWWRRVIPSEAHEIVPIDAIRRPSPIGANRRSVVRLKAGESQHRVRVPEHIHPYSSGILGGLVGGVIMAGLACLYGLIAQYSIWYPVNLLAGVVLSSMGSATLEQLRTFDLTALLAALFGHAMISMLVGILYAVALPMFPKHAFYWAGLAMPLFWSSVVATTLDLINPALNERISWIWFVACQLAFGLVGGYVIARSIRIKTMQTWTMAERAFVEAPGISPERRRDD